MNRLSRKATRNEAKVRNVKKMYHERSSNKSLKAGRSWEKWLMISRWVSKRRLALVNNVISVSSCVERDSKAILSLGTFLSMTRRSEGVHFSRNGFYWHCQWREHFFFSLSLCSAEREREKQEKIDWFLFSSSSSSLRAPIKIRQRVESQSPSSSSSSTKANVGEEEEEKLTVRRFPLHVFFVERDN